MISTLPSLTLTAEKHLKFCKLNPASSVFITDLNDVGGIQAVVKELARGGMINTDALTVNGTVADRIAKAPDADGVIIRKLENPFSQTAVSQFLQATLQRTAQ